MHRLSVWPSLTLMILTAAPGLSFAQNNRYQPTDDERAKIEAGIHSLTETVDKLKSTPPSEAARHSDNLADVEVGLKAAKWILEEGEFYKKSYVDMTLKALELGEQCQAPGRRQDPLAKPPRRHRPRLRLRG